MSKYTAEQVRACILAYKNGDLNYCRSGIMDLLTEYATILDAEGDAGAAGEGEGVPFCPECGTCRDHLPAQAAKVARPCRIAAERSVTDFLKENLGEVPAFQMAEDGDENWSFWVTEDGCSDDTTSYVHADLSIEWYGTAWEAPAAAPVVQAAQVDAAPIPMVLHCPSCRMQHIDAPETHHVDRALDEAGMDNSYSASWDNPPHRSHLCHGCGTIWRPADVPTIGVTATKTHGKADTFKPAAECVPEGWRQALERALPFLDDEAGKYDDDGNNEPLDVADTIRDLLAAPSPGESE